jgi:exosortase
MTTSPYTDAPPRTGLKWLAAISVLAVGVWSYWPTLVDLVDFWRFNPDYSVGALVPPVAIYLVWSDRRRLRALPTSVCWWGFALLLASQVVRLLGLFYMFASLERFSLILALGALVLFFFGHAVTRRLVWLWLFFLLMMPLPSRVHERLAIPLQDLATGSSVFCLEMLGFLVARQGHILRLSGRTAVAIAEACSGLRMLTAFVVVAATLAFLVRRPVWQKAVLVISSVPVAIAANTLRLVATVLLYEWVSDDVAERFFHHFAGLTMMPFAVIVLILELRLLRWLSEPAPAAGEPVPGCPS